MEEETIWQKDCIGDIIDGRHHPYWWDVEATENTGSADIPATEAASEMKK